LRGSPLEVPVPFSFLSVFTSKVEVVPVVGAATDGKDRDDGLVVSFLLLALLLVSFLSWVEGSSITISSAIIILSFSFEAAGSFLSAAVVKM